MARLFKQIVTGVGLALFAGCTGGAGCDSCGGVTPLPGGFDPQQRVENAAAVRITESGLSFLEDNVGTLAESLLGDTAAGGKITFEVPQTSGSLDVFGVGLLNYEICPGGPNAMSNPPECVFEAFLADANLSISTEDPHRIRISGPLPVLLQHMDLDLGWTGDAEMSINGTDSCPTGNTPANINLDVVISVTIDDDPTHARYGYSRIKIEELTIDEGQLEDATHFCGGFIGSVINALKPILFGFIADPLIGNIDGIIEEQLCQPADPLMDPPCPTGTTDVEGVCRYGSSADDECVSIVLGTDGNAQLGGLLAGISPGTEGAMNFMFAAGGDGIDGTGNNYGDLNTTATPGGGTLGMYGGVEPDPLSNCVPISEIPRPSGLMIPQQLYENSLPGFPGDGPHIGLALSETFLNYAFSGMYNSGLFCIGIGGDTLGSLLTSGTLGLIMPSVLELGIQREPQPLAIVLRPTAPPNVTFGNGTSLESDPLLRVGLPGASFDFYIWSLDRYIRFMTTTVDIDVPMNLEVTPEGLVPVLETIGVEALPAENSQLLKEDPAVLSSTLADLIEGQVGGLVGGAIPAVDINGSLSSLGLQLEIPPTVEGQGSPGLTRLESNGENYLGIFATFGLAMQTMSLETEASLVDLDIDMHGLRGATFTETNAPVATLAVSSPGDFGTRAIEYQYRLDGGAWHPFKRSRWLEVSDPALRVQGRHQIEVRGRYADDPYTLDMTPAVVEVVVDAAAPSPTVSTVDELDEVTIEVADLGDASERSRVRHRLGLADELGEITWAEWTEWELAANVRPAVVGDATHIELEALDESGNLGSVQQKLIRGKPITGDEGCGCRTAGGPSGSKSGALAGLALLLGGLFRLAGRRRGRGRGEGGRGEGGPRGDETPRRQPAASSSRPRTTRRHILTGVAGASLVMGAFGSTSGCSCGDDGSPSSNYSCEEPCVPLSQGLIGAYSSGVLVGQDLWVAGYAEADWSHSVSYGDLAVGRLEGDAITWELVDGIPDEPAPDGEKFDLNGWRGGQESPGDDVGLWTSIGADEAGNIAVAYYDRTNKALKYAARDGDSWNVETVDGTPGSDVGRYAKLLFAGGQAFIAYLVVDPSAGGPVTSRLRIAFGGPGAWQFEDAVVDQAGFCKPALCTGGTTCLADYGTCVTAAEGCGGCADGEICADVGNGAACQAVAAEGIETYPDAVATYISAAVDPSGGLGIAFHDRIRGNLEVIKGGGGNWTRVIVDGQDAEGNDTGDVGIGASLAIDASGDYHLAYVDGHKEALRYARVTAGTTPAGFQIVDDGLTLGGAAFSDGQHIVGDDSSIWVSPAGEVHITYQDATAGTLRYAVGTPAGNTPWNVRVLEGDAFGGAFSKIIAGDGAVRLLHWWRVGAGNAQGDIAVITP